MPCSNPLWTDQQRQEFCGQFGLGTAPTSTDSVVITVNRRNIEGGGRAQDFGHDSYRTVLGMRGDLTDAMTLRDRYTMRIGVSNLADKDPPLNGATTCPTGPCNGNTWSQVYDALGRQIFGLVTIDF